MQDLVSFQYYSHFLIKVKPKLYFISQKLIKSTHFQKSSP